MVTQKVVSGKTRISGKTGLNVIEAGFLQLSISSCYELIKEHHESFLANARQSKVDRENIQ